MRVVKEAQIRRNEILDAAELLFKQNGYDNTSTNDILDKVNIARGTLYYHFKSKEDILNALILRINGELIQIAKEIILDHNIPVLERLASVVLSLDEYYEKRWLSLEEIHRPQNALMHQKFRSALLKDVMPILTELIMEGVEQGLFHTPYPQESMEMIMTYISIFFDARFETTEEKRIQRMEAFIFNTERIFGTETGSMRNYMIRMFGYREDEINEADQ